MSRTKLKKIVFVCTGNTCRSPMAEYLLKEALKKKKLRGFKVCSAGTEARKGDLINPKALYTLQLAGIKVGKFSSTPINEKLLKDAFLFICMTEKHKDYLLDARWSVLRKAGEEEIENNVFSFKELVGYDVPDPYGYGEEEYRYVFQMLDRGMYEIIDNLQLRNYALPSKTPATTGQKRGRKKKEIASLEV